VGELRFDISSHANRCNQTLKIDKWLQINCEALSKTILIDWDGWEDDKNKPIKYTQKHAYDMLLGLKDFRKTVEELADQQATFALIDDVEAGND
jgi:hypothetical protein